MNTNVAVEIAAEFLVAAQAVWFLKKHPMGFRRYGAFLALAAGVVGAAVAVARLLNTQVPEFHLIEEIALYLIIFMMLQVSEKLYIDRDDAANICKSFREAMDKMEGIMKRLEEHDTSTH
jgi:hypothetical protein